MLVVVAACAAHCQSQHCRAECADHVVEFVVSHGFELRFGDLRRERPGS